MDTTFINRSDRTLNQVNLIQPNRPLLSHGPTVSAELRFAQSVPRKFRQPIKLVLGMMVEYLN
ncbi:MAG: hypothetical protein KME43_22485 [Myxacorys chilensis ATA2-1-KO14]|jgi:hypothetical protein|nr:hypothetical protein [Myxacorys chilensis ATA2-1-KO14]